MDPRRNLVIADIPIGYVAALVVAILTATLVIASQLRLGDSEPKR